MRVDRALALFHHPPHIPRLPELVRPLIPGQSRLQPVNHHFAPQLHPRPGPAPHPSNHHSAPQLPPRPGPEPPPPRPVHQKPRPQRRQPPHRLRQDLNRPVPHLRQVRPANRLHHVSIGPPHTRRRPTL